MSSPKPKNDVKSLGGFNTESYRNWLTQWDKLDQNYQKHIYNLESYTKEAQVKSSEHGQESKMELNNIALEHVMDQSALAFFYHMDKKSSEAKKWLEKAQSFLEKCVKDGQIPQEYQASFNPVFNSIFNAQSALDAQTNYKIPSESLPPSTIVGSKARACFYGIKQHFFHLLRTDFKDQIDLLRNAIECDESYYYWHLKLYEALRKLRKEGQYHHRQILETPSEDEKKAILTACKLQPNHPSCLAGEILMLADCVKFGVKDAEWTVIEHNDIQYKSREQLVTFIKEQARKIMSSAPTSINCHALIAGIFTKMVTKDLKFSEYCLRQCLKFHPNSVILNFRLADCLLTQAFEARKNKNKNQTSSSKAQEMFDEAQSILENALKNCPYNANFTPLTCLIQILLGRPKENESKLLRIFEKEMKNPDWNDKQKKNILFLEAIFFCMIPSQNNKGIDILCSICENNPSDLKFDDLLYQSRRYGWNLPGRENLTLEEIRKKLIDKKITLDDTAPYKTTVKNVLAQVRDAIKKQEKHQDELNNRANI